MTAIIPTIGRVVWFTNKKLSTHRMAATVCFVTDNGNINITAHRNDGTTFPQTDVPLFQGEAKDCPDMHCCWMPYQQAQAAKNVQQGVANEAGQDEVTGD